tara:strand:+ start:9494 stop:9847 length:354 start_codon:yes stop_codon:yes gene_type:complete
MALRKKLVLGWEGVDYTLMVDMECVDRVDELISIGKTLSRQISGDIRFSHVAKFVSVVLNEAGASTTQESVYESMFSDGATSMEVIQGLLTHMLSAFFPETKKKDTPKRPPAVRRKK